MQCTVELIWQCSFFYTCYFAVKILKGKVKELENVKQPQEEKKKGKHFPTSIF